MLTKKDKFSNQLTGLIITLTRPVLLLTFGCMLSILFHHDLKAQCTINDPQDQTGCSGATVTFNASSTSSTVNHHIWYDQYFNGIEATSENMIEYQPGSGQVAWVSTLTVYLTSNATYYVAASCDLSDKRAVQFTIQNSSPINLGMSPSSPPDNLCAGETITLTASGGSNYQWRFNDPDDPNYTGGTTKTATQSGTYYLRGTNGCGQWQNNSITLNFKPTMTNVGISGTSSLCQGSVTTTQYNQTGFNVEQTSWSITDNDPNANATITPYTGLVSWNGIVGQATVSMTAYGCHGTSFSPPNKIVDITPQPTLSQCAISHTSTHTACSASELSATSTSTYVKSHKWFTSQTGGNEIGVTQGPSEYGGAWVSRFTGYFDQTVTYWVEPQCDCNMAGTRVAVGFIADPGTNIGLTMTAAAPVTEPFNLCAGETVRLDGTGGTGYEWRLNDPNKVIPDAESAFINVTQSGTWYLKGANSCGHWKDGGSIALTFKQPLADLGIDGASSYCQNTVSTDFSPVSGTTGIEAAKWYISDNDPLADAQIDINSGIVQWNGIVGTAAVRMVGYGCHSTTAEVTRNVQLDPIPNNLTVVPNEGNFCKGMRPISTFTVTGKDATTYSWSVSGQGNSISDSGEQNVNGNRTENAQVIWSSTFEGEATISVIAHGCNNSQVSASTPQTVFPLPAVSTIPDISSIMTFRTDFIDVTANAPTAVTYQWSKNGYIIPDATSSSYRVLAPAVYGIKVTDANGCTGQRALTIYGENNYNYIIENILQADKKTNGEPISEAEIPALTVEQRAQNIQYFDGLGRGMQIVSTQASPSPAKHDIVQPITYDLSSRENFKHLPITLQSNGFYKENIIDYSTKAYINGAQSFYEANSDNKIADDPKPYAETKFENSPLNRVLKQGAPGEDFQPNSDPSLDHSIKRQYMYNTEQEVILFQYDQATALVKVDDDAEKKYYAPNELFANKAFDEHNNEVIEYTDKEGRTVCKKLQYEGTGTSKKYTSTYYIYDDLGELVIVLPPEGVKKMEEITGQQ